MPRTLITAYVPLGPHPGTVAANALDTAPVNSDVANGNYFIGTGRDLVHIRNADAAPQTVTFTSKADAMGRLGTITAYSLGISETMAFWFGDLRGWDQGGGQIFIDCSDSDMSITIYRIP